MDLRISFPPLRLLSRTFPRNQTRCPEPPWQSRRREVMEDTYTTRCFAPSALRDRPPPVCRPTRTFPASRTIPFHTGKRHRNALYYFFSLPSSRLAWALLSWEPHPPADPAKPRSAGERSCRGSAQVRSRLTKLQACGSLKQIILRKLLLSNS